MLEARHASEIAARFGLGSDAVLSGPIARGELGQVWRLRTSSGTWAVKDPFELLSAAEVTDDALYQDVVLAAGVPMPAIVRMLDGDVLADLGSAQVRVYEWVDLGQRDPWLDPVDVGRLVASIHRVQHVGRSPVDPWYTDPVGADRWDELVHEAAAAGAPFAEQLADLRDELVGLEGLLEWPADLQTCHRDLFADNVVRTSVGQLCVIDWENSGLAEPSQELGPVVFEFACGDVGRASALYEAYVDAGGPGRIERHGHFSMAIAQLGHIGELSCRRWLDPTRRTGREHNARRVEEFVTKPITRELIDELLETISG